jgi:hypothetical protein
VYPSNVTIVRTACRHLNIKKREIVLINFGTKIYETETQKAYRAINVTLKTPSCRQTQPFEEMASEEKKRPTSGLALPRRLYTNNRAYFFGK